MEGFKGLTWTCARTSCAGSCAIFSKWPRNGREAMGTSRNGREIPRIGRENPTAGRKNVFYTNENANSKVHESSRKFTPKHRSLESFSRKFTQVHAKSRAPTPQEKNTKSRKKTESGVASPEISEVHAQNRPTTIPEMAPET